MLKKIKMNIPNILTVSRIISCFLAAILFMIGNINLAIVMYIYGAVSDAMDGIAARKLNAFTKLGQKLDPISDKIYALSLIIPAIIMGNLLMIIPLVFESIIGYTNSYNQLKTKEIVTERIGKIKTVSLFPTMILGLICTKIPGCYFAFIPALLLSTHLQKQSINAYHNQIITSYEEKNDNINSDNEMKKEEKVLTLKEKYINLKQELITCITVPIEKKDIKERKK